MGREAVYINLVILIYSESERGFGIGDYLNELADGCRVRVYFTLVYALPDEIEQKIQGWILH